MTRLLNFFNTLNIYNKYRRCSFKAVGYIHLENAFNI